MSYQLHLGNCLELLPTLDAGSIDAIITDPPYGIAYQSAWRIDKQDRFDVIQGDTELDFAWLDEADRLLRDQSSLFVFCRWDVQEQFRDAIAQRFTVRSQVVWDRGIHGLGDLNAQYAPCHDIAWFATKGKFAFPNGRPKSVYRVDRVSADKLIHPTQKPLPLMKVIINDLTRPGDTVLDCFAGSATTGIACVKTGRNFVGIEIDPVYHAIGLRGMADALAQPMLFEVTA